MDVLPSSKRQKRSHVYVDGKLIKKVMSKDPPVAASKKPPSTTEAGCTALKNPNEELPKTTP